MRVFDLSSPVPEDAQHAVVAIGNFDAVHRGHHALLEIARKKAFDQGRPFAVLTFEPHPRRLFRPDDPPFRVTPLPVKLYRFEKSKVEIVYLLAFTWDLAHLCAEDFILHVLKAKIGASDLIVGSDFHFGSNRSGSIKTLQDAGFHCTIIDQIKDAQCGVYSATRIRGLIQSGHIDEANSLLGWEWEIRGPVQGGDKRGRELGYPTANVPLGETIHPAYGVYAGLVQIEGESSWRPAAVNIGIRPMFAVPTALVEAHILDFSGDLYGKTLRIRPVAKLRDEARFDTLEALKARIGADCDCCRVLLSNRA